VSDIEGDATATSEDARAGWIESGKESVAIAHFSARDEPSSDALEIGLARLFLLAMAL
jgi:hypothetical protein